MLKNLGIVALIIAGFAGFIYLIVLDETRMSKERVAIRKSAFRSGKEYVIRRSSSGNSSEVELDNQEALANGYEIFDTSTAGGNGWESFTAVYRKKKASDGN